MADDISQNNLVGEVGFALTEFNVHSNGVFEDRTDDLDTPSRFARLGGIFTGLANEQPDELYLFKFDSRAEDSFFQKNAIFTNSRFEAPYDVGGATKAAGVLKLFTKGFVGAQDLLEEASHSVNSLDVATSYHDSKDTYFMLSANESTVDRNLTFDLSSLGVQPGAIVQIEEVSKSRLAEVTERLVVPSNGQINVQQSGESVLLVSVPKTAPDQQTTLMATDDATVRAGSNVNNNAGSSNNIYVRNVADIPNGRAVGLVQFDTSAVSASVDVERAVLQLHGEVTEGPADYVTAHVYGIIGDDWDESSITWNTTENLGDSLGTATLVADNFVTGIGDTAEFLGHLTVNQNFEPVALDVSEFLQQHSGQSVRFLITREVRFDGEAVDRSLGAIRFDSKDNSSGLGPQLLLELRAVQLLCDFDADGDCDHDDINSLYGTNPTSGDISNWLSQAEGPANLWKTDTTRNPDGAVTDQYVLGDANLDGDIDSTDLGLLLNSFGSTGSPNWLNGNLNADTVIDSTDLGLLLNNFGSTSATSAVAIPEPSPLVPLALGVLMMAIPRRR